MANKKTIHVCILTSAHPIDDVRVSHKIGESLRSAGFRVTWIGPNNAFFDTISYNQYDITYRLFPSSKGKLGRILGGIKAYLSAKKEKDIQVFYAPDPDSALIATLLAGKNNSRVIFDIHEIYHDAMLNRWLSGLLAIIGGYIIRVSLLKICNRCDLVIGVSQSVLEPYLATKTKKLVVMNCAPIWFSNDNQLKNSIFDNDKFVILHGKANPSRGTKIVLEALSLAKDHIPGLRCIMFDTFQSNVDNVELKEFQKQIEGLGLKDIIILKKGVPLQEMPEIIQNCNLGVIAYGRKLGVDSLPNKLFEFMAIGLPIIAPNYSFEIARIMKKEKCGLIVDFENPKEVAGAFIELFNNPVLQYEMGRRGRYAFERQYNWQTEVKPFIKQIKNWFPDY